MSEGSRTFDPLKCYEQLRGNILADSHYLSGGQEVLQRQGMRCWITYIERFNSLLAADTTLSEPISTRPSFTLVPEVRLGSQLNSLLAEIVLTISKGGL